MAKSIKTEQEAVQQEKLVETVSKAEQFLNDNIKVILGCVAAVIVIAAGVLCYSHFYLAPKQAEAAAQMYHAEQLFQNGNYELALKGDGNVAGFEEIISEYGSKAAESVYFYAGVCALQLGEFEDAVKYLKKYDGNEPILKGRALCNIGDAYCGLGEYENAVKYFEQAAKTSDNMFSAEYLLKAGLCHEALGNNAKALNCYNTIKNDYSQSLEAYDIDKYIARIAE